MEKVPGHGLCPDLSGPGRPARSMHIPDLDSSAAKLLYLAISCLEIAHWSILLRGIEGHGEEGREEGGRKGGREGGRDGGTEGRRKEGGREAKSDGLGGRDYGGDPAQDLI